jgi:hypothetical protein
MYATDAFSAIRYDTIYELDNRTKVRAEALNQRRGLLIARETMRGPGL